MKNYNLQIVKKIGKYISKQLYLNIFSLFFDEDFDTFEVPGLFM